MVNTWLISTNKLSSFKKSFSIFFFSFAGRQHRTVRCQWGGRKCFGYHNELETQKFCSNQHLRTFLCPHKAKFNDKYAKVIPNTDGRILE